MSEQCKIKTSEIWKCMRFLRGRLGSVQVLHQQVLLNPRHPLPLVVCTYKCWGPRVNQHLRWGLIIPLHSQ